MAGSFQRRRIREPGRAQGLEALTSDVWYTLIYLPPSERRLLVARRTRIWSEPLRRHGLTRDEVDRLLERKARWLDREEVRGRTPPVAEQVERVCAWAGCRTDPRAMAEELDRALLRARVRPAPGVERALRALEDEGVPLGIVSNVLHETGRGARGLLDRLGLLPRFRVAAFSCEHPWAKPSAGLFRLVARYLGVPPSRTVHVGDLGYDLAGARRAGYRAWLYVGLERLNRYLPGQADRRTLDDRDVVRSWTGVPRKFFAERLAS